MELMGGAQASAGEEGRRKGHGRARPGAGLWPLRHCRAARAGEGKEKGRGEWVAAGQKQRGGEIEPKWLYPFSFPFPFSLLKYAYV